MLVRPFELIVLITYGISQVETLAPLVPQPVLNALK